MLELYVTDVKDVKAYTIMNKAVRGVRVKYLLHKGMVTT